MENTNVNVEKNNQQAETPTQANSKVPKSYQKWFDLVKKECEETRALATKIAEEHISEINKLLFMYFKKGRTLGIQMTKSEIAVCMIISEEKRNRLTSLPIPHYDLVSFCPIAQREFFAVYIQYMKEEYGEDFVAYEMFSLGPEDHIEEVLPWAKIIPKSKDSKNTQKSKQVDPDSDDDIRMIFSRRDQS